MNRRELLSMAGAMSPGATLGTLNALADGHGKTDDNKMMAPLGNHHLHFCGIHCDKKDPRIHIVTQHYCGMFGGGMHQCLLYDLVGKNARLLGVGCSHCGRHSSMHSASVGRSRHPLSEAKTAPDGAVEFATHFPKPGICARRGASSNETVRSSPCRS